MRLGEIGGPRAKTSLETACATSELLHVRSAPPRQILGDALTHQLGDRALFPPRLGLERPRLLLGQLNLGSYHAIMIANQPA